MSRPSNALQVQEWLAGWLVAGVVPSRFSHHPKMEVARFSEISK
jgi:hypothetical protein